MEMIMWLLLILLVHLLMVIYVYFGKMYVIKITIYYWFGSLLSIFLLIPMLLKGVDVQNLRYPRIALKKISKLFGLKFTATGLENVNIDGPCVLISNHQSSIDIFTMAEFTPDGCAILVKKEIKWAGPFGLMSWLCDSLYVDRFNSQRAKATIDAASDFIHRKKMKVLVYPEGTRNSRGGLLPFKKGAFNLAVEAQIPLVPVVVSSYQSFLRPEQNLFTHGNVSIKCLPAISTTGLTVHDVPGLCDKVREKMLQVLHEL